MASRLLEKQHRRTHVIYLHDFEFSCWGGEHVYATKLILHACAAAGCMGKNLVRFWIQNVAHASQMLQVHQHIEDFIWFLVSDMRSLSSFLRGSAANHPLV